MRKLIVDAEADGLLNEATKIWTLQIKELNRDNWLEFRIDRDTSVSQIRRALTGNVVIGHNVIKYDVPLLEKLWGNISPPKVVDTYVMSSVLWPDRPAVPGIKGGPHSLKAWGHRLGEYKGEFSEEEGAFDTFSEEMVEYCKQDVVVTEKLYNHLLHEMETF